VSNAVDGVAEKTIPAVLEDDLYQITVMAAGGGMTENVGPDGHPPERKHFGEKVLLVAQFGKVYRVTPDLLHGGSAEGEIGGKYQGKSAGKAGKN